MAGKIIIAIDGFSSCGKSTLARDLARKLGYRYIDTGAMYRAVTYYFYMNRVNIENHEEIMEALRHIRIDFDYQASGGAQITILNGQDIEREIRSQEISGRVSSVSAIKEVRSFLVKQQQELGAEKGIVMDGRDIGTVVFPNAELKLYMTADPEVRAKRRYDELLRAGTQVSLKEIEDNIRDRDYKDSHREESPLRQAQDAIVVLDNTYITQDVQLERAFDMAMEKINAQ